MNDYGKAEAAFGKAAQMDATGAAAAAFGPSAAQIPNRAAGAGGQTGGQTDGAGGAGMADALRGTYDQLMAAARATANRYLRFGTNGANRNAQTLADAAKDAAGEGGGGGGGGEGGSGSASAQSASPSGGAAALRMLAEPSFGQGGAMGANAQPTIDIDGSTAYLGGIDANDRAAVDSASNDIRGDLAWMRDNDYIDNGAKVEG